jgi:hypothetical protein
MDNDFVSSGNSLEELVEDWEILDEHIRRYTSDTHQTYNVIDIDAVRPLGYIEDLEGV